ncbi:hypothetical protein O6H91_06G020600 [Diphasiastrum complanatum]|uniref:Uncharacterized protein n=2 Tax=Diphasiastrum complanatum TaxID=34168 RepID=A0ACC2DB47_DIPCM|nr:hypothetical protein O6H91_06G020600 [Diphasiastrum complanatum]KAJ7551565.1 hypothetical protein O6H91_06G020600 [Diphasiastrum complanatum]
MAEFSEQALGAALLNIVSRGQALVAELQRLSAHVPAPFESSSTHIYAPVLFDFKYFKSPEFYEERIEADPKLIALDDEFKESYLLVLERFFWLFNGIVNYYQDLLRYLEDLEEGIYIQSTMESVLQNEDGKQLLVEALVLHGLLLFLLDHSLTGTQQELLFVAYYRCKNASDIPNFDSICSLCRSFPPPPTSALSSVASLLQASPAPVTATMLMLPKPEELLAKFPFPDSVIHLVIERVRSDDLYNQIRHYPNPKHRSTALAAQAGSLYVLLFYVPQILHSQNTVMREIVEKFFEVCWVVPIFMGFTVDLISSWSRFKAAKIALASVVSPVSVRNVSQMHYTKLTGLLAELGLLLSEGVLSQDYVLNNMPQLLICLRNCNVTIRWILLHSTTANRKLRDIVVGNALNQTAGEEVLLTLLLDTSRLEFELKKIYEDLLETKESRWQQCRTNAADCMQELSDYFSGSRVLSRKVKDENLQVWFSKMASQIRSLDYKEASRVGRKIQHMIAALEEVEQFHQIEASLQSKQYLSEIRAQLQGMICILNVHERTLATLSVVTDAAYAWGLMETFTRIIHERIQSDPFTVLKLQCLFLKLKSIMDIPLLRISQCHSADLFSVSQYYSSELVAYVQRVLEVIPVSMFAILNEVIMAQTKRLRALPGRIEKESFRDYAQVDVRYALAKATCQVAVFTQGIMSMRKTFMGAIELDPRQLLEDGIRKQLVKEIANSLNSIIVFPTVQAEEFEEKIQELCSCFQSQRQSMEYFQDYVHVHGLHLWQEEYTRVVNFNTEQECNSYLKRKIKAWRSSFQNPEIPIPLFPPPSKDLSKASNFMGRIVYKLLHLTDPTRSMYLAPMSGWFDADGKELVGLRTFTLLQTSLGAVGLVGVNRLLCFEATKSLRLFLSSLQSEMDTGLLERLQVLEGALTPPSAIPDAGVTVYADYAAKGRTSQTWGLCSETLAHLGQIQLIRLLIASHLRAASQGESCSISFVLDGINRAVLADARSKSNASITDYNSETDEGKLLGDLSKQSKMCGFYSPMNTIYVTAEPPKHFALVLFIITISQLPRYVVDKHLGTLTSRMKKTALDCCPLVIGFVTLLRQFHPSYLGLYIQYLGQYVQTHIDKFSLKSSLSDLNNKSGDMHLEIVNTVYWLFSLGKHADVPYELLETSLPPFTLQSFAK